MSPSTIDGARGRLLDDGVEELNPDVSSVSLDPAHQSLTDAVRLIYRVIQAFIVLLIVLFIGSGYQSVGEGERGIKLVFGRVTGRDLSPGAQWTAPFPVGELVKVGIGEQRVLLLDSFWPDVPREMRNWPLDQLSGRKPSLKPGVDGSLITAEGNIAHATWTASYRRVDVAAWAENIHETHEQRIVRAALERGVVRAVAESTVDQLLKQSSGSADSVAGEGRIEGRVHRIAQETLDGLDAGIRIERVTLERQAPPLRIYNDFQAVANAEAVAAREREESQRYRREALNAMAGPAHEQLLALIDEFEAATDADDDAAAADALARFDATIDPEAGSDLDPSARAAGRVTQIINEARQYRTDVVAGTRAEAARFRAKLGQYRTNPGVFVVGEWSDAVTAFLDSASPEVFLAPAGSDSTLIRLNPDPDIVKELEAARNRAQVTGTMEQAEQRARRSAAERYRRSLEERRP